MYDFEVTYKGKWPSTNDLRNKHWRSNQSLKESWRTKLGILIREQKPKRLENFRIVVKYNSRLDPDNVTLKFFCDSLKDCGVIIDDNKKYFRGFSIDPDESLSHNTYVLKVTEAEWQKSNN